MPFDAQSTPADLAAATADYAVPLTVRQGFRCIDPVAANALQGRIVAEIMALTGCDEARASVGAGGFVNMRSVPHYGLNDQTGEAGLYVLRQWLAAKVAAYRAQARRAA